MAKDDGGLLSKVMRFVRSPATNWADAESEEFSGDSKQMLKDMIERRRRNDFVRKREFDMLRKLRRKNVAVVEPGIPRPSFFQSSLPSKSQERAKTIKKINDIEAQMSQLWWKSRGPKGAAGAKPKEYVASDITDVNSDFMSDSLPPPSKKIVATTFVPTQQQTDSTMALSRPSTATRIDTRSGAVQQISTMPDKPSSGSGFGPSSTKDGRTVFSASRFHAVEVAEYVHDPEQEEAAIRFANGDIPGAEACLLDAVSAKGPRNENVELWLALLDLYRATGQQDKFDQKAIDFAARFGRSAPLWFNLPELVAKMAPASAAPPAVIDPHWESPPQFRLQSIALLNVALTKAPQPWCIDWRKLSGFDDAVAEPLYRVFVGWAEKSVKLRFMGVSALDAALRARTPSGDKSVPSFWWMLRMEALRVMGRPDEFEVVALDYCVTYEVSPPSWERTVCDFLSLDGDGFTGSSQAIVGDSVHSAWNSSLDGNYPESLLTTGSPSLSGTVTGQGAANFGSVDLAGQLIGGADTALVSLDEKLQGADVLVISCAQLIRTDFSAAGAILNWVMARRAEGRQVQFVDMHRLVATFFNVIGIGDSALIVPRSD